MISFLAGGITASQTATVIAPLVEYLKPCDFISSKTCEVIFVPCFFMHFSTILPSCFLPTKKSTSNLKASSGVFLLTKPKSCGIGLLKIIFPAVVFIIPVISLPSNSTVLLTLIFA